MNLQSVHFRVFFSVHAGGGACPVQQKDKGLVMLLHKWMCEA